MIATPPLPRSKAWLLAARPKTLPAAVGPVVVGAALAHAGGAFALGPALAALLAALLLQIGSNLANDYFDFFKGADTAARLGPPRATASGLIRPGEMRLGMVLTFGAAAMIGLYLVTVGGLPVLVIGLASILAALAYTGGPLPFGYYGLGDLFVFLFFGLVAVCGAYYVQALALTWPVVITAVAPGLLITAILVVNNLRDIDTDRQAGKRTLAVLFGRRFARLEYACLLLFAYLVPLVLWQTGAYSPWVLLPWMTGPLAFTLARTTYRSAGSSLNTTLAGTAQLSLWFCLLLALGIIL